MFDLANLPADWPNGRYFGRVDFGYGPTPMSVVNGCVGDLSSVAPTISQAIEQLVAEVSPAGTPIGDFDEIVAAGEALLLSPIDLHAVKAAGVTFAVSAIERVIEEAARGDAAAATSVRDRLERRVGAGVRAVIPGSAEATALKTALIEEGLWSQYLEVAIGPDAEIFTKAQPLSTVGPGAEIGIRSDSAWNNPEPEIVLIVDSRGHAIGAALGNDVNLRDFEGRSALLLGKAKDNNASCSIGPLIRLFDDSFTMDDVRAAEVTLTVRGTDGYLLEGRSSMREISRDPEALIAQAMSEHHYPDGFALFLGTLFAPTQDRDLPGRGFTHRVGDLVSIATPKLGTLVNRVTTSRDAPPWSLGIGGLIENLAARGLIGVA